MGGEGAKEAASAPGSFLTLDTGQEGREVGPGSTSGTPFSMWDGRGVLYEK